MRSGQKLLRPLIKRFKTESKSFLKNINLLKNKTMKRVSLLFSLIIAISFSAFAQSNKEEVELFQSVFGMEKKAVVQGFINLEGNEASAFWTVYDEYETARKAHGQKRIKLLTKYVEGYLEFDDAKTEGIMKEMMALGKEYNNLIQKYYKRVKKTSGAKVGAQFFQIESYFQSVIRLALMEEIPFIGEFDF